MAMTVVCPSCARKLNVPDNLIGELVKCPVCGQNFKVEAEPVSGAPEKRPVEPKVTAPHEVEPIAGNKKDEDAPTWEFSPRRRRDLEPHRGTIILVLGILSICIGCVGIIFGPIAWVMGSADLKAIRAGRMDPLGEGTTKAGYICGIIGTCLQLVGFCGCCGMGILQNAMN